MLLVVVLVMLMLVVLVLLVMLALFCDVSFVNVFIDVIQRVYTRC